MRRSHTRSGAARTRAWALRLALGAGLALGTLALPGAGPSPDGAAVDVAGPAVPPGAAEPAPAPPYLGFYAPPDRPFAVAAVPERGARPVPAMPEPTPDVAEDGAEPPAPAPARATAPTPPAPSPLRVAPPGAPAPSGGLAAGAVERLFDPLAGVRPASRLPLLRSRIALHGTVRTTEKDSDPDVATDADARGRPVVAPGTPAPIAAASPPASVPVPRLVASGGLPPSTPRTTPPSTRTRSALPPARPAPSAPSVAADRPPASPASPRVPVTARPTVAASAPASPPAASPLHADASPPARPPAPGPPAPAAPPVGKPASAPGAPPVLVVASALDVEELRPPAAAGASTPSGVAIGPGGRLGGSGRLGGIRNDGTLAPGHSPGLVEVEGDLVQSESGALDIELGGTDPEDYDRILVEGAISLAGELHVLLIDGFDPRVGDVFDVLEGDSIAVGDLDVFLPALDGGRSLVAGVAAVGDRSVFRIATLGLAVVPEPASALLLASGLAALATLRRRG